MINARFIKNESGIVCNNYSVLSLFVLLVLSISKDIEKGNFNENLNLLTSFGLTLILDRFFVIA